MTDIHELKGNYCVFKEAIVLLPFMIAITDKAKGKLIMVLLYGL